MKRFGLAALLLGTLLPGTSLAQKRSEKKAEPEEVRCDDKLRADTLEDFTKAITSGDNDGALNALVTVVEDPEAEPCHGVAYASMGGLLQAREYPYAALLSYGAAIKLNADGASEAVAPALTLGEEVGDAAYLEEVFAVNVGLDVDPETRSHLAYLAARGSFAQGQLSTALGILALVGKDSADFGKAQALKGVVLAQQGRWDDALAALLVAESLLGSDPEAKDVVDLNLGRVYYAAGNYPRAAEYYAKVRRESHWWPEAQFERAWAHYGMSDMNGVLSFTMTAHSPFYQDWYFPEAELLRVYGLFLMCKFPEASKDIDAFQERWTPIRDELQGQITGMSAQDVWEDARRFLDSSSKGEGDSELGELVLRDVPFDDRFGDATHAVDAAGRELDRLQGDGNDWTRHAFQLVSERQKSLILSEGGRLKSDIEGRVDEISQMLNTTEIAKLDMLRLERKLYESASLIGELPPVDRQAYRRERVRKGYVMWPWEGEYWADEVGYYRVEAHLECPQGLTPGG